MNTTTSTRSRSSNSGGRTFSKGRPKAKRSSSFANKSDSTAQPKRSFGNRSDSTTSGPRRSFKSTSGAKPRFNKNNRGERPQQKRSGGGKKRPSFNPSQFINKNPIEIKEEAYEPKNTFATFGLNEALVNSIHAMGITIPSPIQDQIIPEILKGNDVIGLAETGTGKTAAFLVPLLEKTITDSNRQTLILAPTRELAIQIEQELYKLTRGFKIYSAVVVGGTSSRPQIRNLGRKNHFIIGTPGRVLDLAKQGYLKAQNTTTVVLDEADRMLDMGFIGDIKKILGYTPKDRETLLFSATMPDSIKKLVHEFLRNPVEISVRKKDVTDSIAQDVVRFSHDTKYETLLKLLGDAEFKRVIIFGSMKHSVEKLSQKLTQSGIESESIHGNKNHNQRQRSLKKFKSGNARVLVATDVAARGIHVDNVTHVINYDLPNAFEDYVHRIGRTGRGDQKGQALTFVPKD